MIYLVTSHVFLSFLRGAMQGVEGVTETTKKLSVNDASTEASGDHAG